MLDLVAKNLALAPDCVQVLSRAQDVLFADAAATDAVLSAVKVLIQSRSDEAESRLRTAAQIVNLPWQTVAVVMLIQAVPAMGQMYREKAIAEQILWDTLIDLKCKLEESYNLTGVWGTEAVDWYARVYNARIIKLGRLEFEPIAYRWDTPYGNIQKGDPVMNVPIPSCGPMLLADVLASFKKAYEFFGYQQPMPVVMASWLLYPPICETVMKPGSNMRNLYELFEVVEQYEDPNNRNFWRVFHMPYGEGVLDRVPLDNSLRRGICAFMKSGHHMGIGRCALLFDGENVIHK